MGLERWFGPQFEVKYENIAGFSHKIPVIDYKLCGCCGCPYSKKTGNTETPYIIDFYKPLNRPILKIELDIKTPSLNWILGNGYHIFSVEDLDKYNGTYFQIIERNQYGCIFPQNFISAQLISAPVPVSSKSAITSFGRYVVSPGTNNSPTLYEQYIKSEEEALEKCQHPQLTDLPLPDDAYQPYPHTPPKPFSFIDDNTNNFGINIYSSSDVVKNKNSNTYRRIFSNLYIEPYLQTYQGFSWSNDNYRNDFGAIIFDNILDLNPDNGFYDSSEIKIKFREPLTAKQYIDGDYIIYWNYSGFGYTKNTNCGNPTDISELENFEGTITAQIIEREDEI